MIHSTIVSPHRLSGAAEAMVGICSCTQEVKGTVCKTVIASSSLAMSCFPPNKASDLLANFVKNFSREIRPKAVSSSSR